MLLLFQYKYIILLFIFCIPLEGKPQGFTQEETLIKDALKLTNSAPNESIKIGEHLLQKAQLDTEKIIPNLILSKSYFYKGDLSKALIHAFDVVHCSKKQNSVEVIQSQLIIYDILQNLYLDGQAKKYLQKLQESISLVSLNNSKSEFTAKIKLIDIKASLQRQQFDLAKKLINNIDEALLQSIFQNPDLHRQYMIYEGILLANTDLFNQAFDKLTSAKKFSDSRENKNYVEATLIRFELGRLYAFKKQHTKAIESYNESLRFANQLGHLPYMVEINQQLAINHLAINDKSTYSLYNDQFLKLNDKLEQAEQHAVNVAFNLINNQQEATLEAKKKGMKFYLYITIAITGLVVFILVVFTLKSVWKQKRLKEIVRYLEASRSVVANQKEKPAKKVEVAKTLIPEETEKLLIEKLQKFEKSDKFLSKDMSLAVLAGHFDTNTKYLSGVINSHYQDNYNTYINKLRVNYIIEKLKADPNYRHYKISYLAEVGGFSSHSAFGAVFKSITKITPATFIELLNSEIDEHVDLEQVIHES